MFTLRVRNPFGCHEMSCVKLPAAVAFPTDDRLLKRIEESRRALPKDNMKSLRTHREPLNVVSACVQRVRDIDARPLSRVELARAAVDVAETRLALPQLVRIDELYLRSKVAAGQR